LKKFFSLSIILFLLITLTNSSKLSKNLKNPSDTLDSEITENIDNEDTSLIKVDELTDVNNDKLTDINDEEKLNDNGDAIIEDKPSDSLVDNNNITSLDTEDNNSKGNDVVPSYSINFGYIHELSNPSTTPSIVVDEAEFFFQEEALNEAIIDEKAMLDDDGKYIIFNPYYVRNDYDIVTEYTVSENCKYYLCSYLVIDLFGKKLPNGMLSNELIEVTLEEYIKAVEYFKSDNYYMMTWFDLENDKVVKLYQQYRS